MLLLRNATLYDPEPRGRADVFVAGGQIAAVAPSLPAVALPVEEIDLDGAVLSPGLVDAHVHVGGGGGEGGAETRVPPVPPSRFVRAGVTTVIGLLGTDGSTRTIAELLANCRGLDALGLTAFAYTGSYEVPPVTLTGSVRGDLVHVDRIVAIGEVAISDHRSSQPTFDEIVRLAADAHVAGLMTRKAGLLHLHLGDGPRGLALLRRALEETELPARVFHPTHTNRNPTLWQETLAWGERGGYADVTAFPAHDLDGARPAWACAAEWLAAGLDPRRLTMSSDGGGCLPTFDADGNLVRMGVGDSGGLVDDLRGLRAAGVPLERAFALVTSNVADLFRLRGKGRVAPGADADLVVWTPELRPDLVVARGRVVARGGSPVLRGLFEADDR